MEKSSMYYNRTLLSTILSLLLSSAIFSQGNCLVYPANSGERLACELSYRAVTYAQGGRDSQLLFDNAIALGPDYAYSYYQKSVPFFKRGLFIEGIKLLNKAVELDPQNYLTYRAYWYFSQRSFAACIADLEKYYYQISGSIHPTPGGEFEMRMLLAMSYAQTGQIQKAINLAEFGIENYESMNYYIGAYDYHVLGMLYYFNNEMEKAISAFAQQFTQNDRLADTYYYMAMTYKALGNEADRLEMLQESLARFDGINGGYSFSAFGDYNINRLDVRTELGNRFN